MPRSADLKRARAYQITLAERRQAVGLKQEDVAAKLRVRQSSVSRWETGAAPMPLWAVLAYKRMLKGRNDNET